MGDIKLKAACEECPHNHEPVYPGSLCESCLTDDMDKSKKVQNSNQEKN